MGPMARGREREEGRTVPVGRTAGETVGGAPGREPGTIHGDTLIPARRGGAKGPGGGEDALARTLRRWARPTSVDDLAARGVKTVRSVSMARMGALIEKAVNRALIERTLASEGDDALSLSQSARDQFMRLAKDAAGTGEPLDDDAALRGRATSTLDRLKRELADRRKSLADHERKLSGGELDASEDARLTERLRELFALHGDAGDRLLCGETVDLVLGEVSTIRRRARQARLEEHQREVHQLERRIAKLSLLLGETEDQLRKVRLAKNVDTGISSIYDAVQGLDGGDAQFEQKSMLMKSIFEANLALR